MTASLTDIHPDRLPIASLLALATAAVITLLTEALPAGLLPQRRSANAEPRACQQVVEIRCDDFRGGGKD